ncbi:type VII secretion protein EccCa [Georgenia sp. Z1491]|uniref:type VII secretion protein EccCa n=1 Tax=Georgenia sp. Z1491 TaxID=3416707 RepID=UPI003CF4015E
MVRPSTKAPPPPPQSEETLQVPPELPEPEGMQNILMMVVPMIGSMGMMGVMMFGGGSGNQRMVLMGGAMMLAMVLMVAMNIIRQRNQHKKAVMDSRREYLAYLTDLRKKVRTAAKMQLDYSAWRMPDPRSLAAVGEEGSRTWERSPDDEDFLLTRIGSATQPLSLDLKSPEIPTLAKLDPVTASAAHRFLVTHREVSGLPLGMDLQAFARIEVAGSEDAARSLARGVITHLATFVSPEDLRIAVIASEEALPEWEWIKWLPHALSPRVSDAVGPARMLTTSLAHLADLLPAGIAERPRFGLSGGDPELPHVLVVVDGGDVPAVNPVLTPDGVMGVTVLDLPETWEALVSPSTLRLLLHDAVDEGPLAGATPVEILQVGAEPQIGIADQLGVPGAEAAARRLTARLASIRSGQIQADPTEDGEAAAEVSAELTDLLGLGDVRDLDVAQAWRPRLPRDRLRVPIGLTPEGRVVQLDIKESAQQGMGPHGLIIGATGSGKSEVLRTLVLALTMTHSSEALNLVLVDFKGGATFAGMADMPHVSAIITNLGEELTLVDRMEDALRGEMVRRQELLRAAGNFANVTDYEKARANGRTDLEPLPALMIICDEFSELLSAKPEFAELFVAIGRLGRSLSMHLLLSSQRLEEGRLRGLESHLSYRIGLRTFSAQESRTVLGVTDAYDLPPMPGVGYLKPDTTTMIRFRAAYVSGAPPVRRRRKRSEGGGAQQQVEQIDIDISPYTAAPVLGESPEELQRRLEAADDADREIEERQAAEAEKKAEEERKNQPSTFDIGVSRMEGQGPPAHVVWLPPLDVPQTFDELMPDLTVTPELGLHSPRWRDAGALTLPLGVVDKPLEQRREDLVFDLSGAGGHMAIVGGPRTGKSTAARSIVTSIALTRTPLEAQIYVLDFGGGTFAAMTDLAHVAGVATRGEPDVVRRIVAEMRQLVDEREAFFRANKIDSIETYRIRRAEGRVDDGYGDIFLVVDGWPTIKADFDDLEIPLQQLAGRGLTFGFHIIGTANRWMDFRMQLKDMIGSRLELRLGDALDSDVDRKLAKNIPNRPGRGLAKSKHHILTALPRVDGDGDSGTLGAGVDDMVRRVNESWTGRRGPKLRLLPELISLDEIRAQATEQELAGGILLGVDEARLAPVVLDPSAEPLMFLLGDSKSGKSTFLRAVAAEIARLNGPKEAQIIAVDLRRALLGELPEKHLGLYLSTHEMATTELKGLAGFLKGRLPGPDVTPDQLRSRSWWSGSEVYILVDDYDLVNTSAGNPLSALQPLMAQAKDIGLHVVITRRIGGASRAMFEPVMQTMTDLAAPAYLLSGNPDDGPVIGRIRAKKTNAGRAQMITRDRGNEVGQLAWLPKIHG